MIIIPCITSDIDKGFCTLDDKVNTSPYAIITLIITVILQSLSFKKFMYRNEGVIIEKILITLNE